MDILVLRLIHVGAGAFWVGAVFTFFLFVQRTAAALGPEGQRFMYDLIHRRHLANTILTSAIITVLAGITLLVITSNGLDPDILFDASRLGYTVGGLSAILTLGIGALYVHPRTRITERTLGAFLEAGRPPTDEERQTLMRAGGEARRAGRVILIGLTVAILSMASAQYWPVVLS